LNKPTPEHQYNPYTLVMERDVNLNEDPSSENPPNQIADDGSEAVYYGFYTGRGALKHTQAGE